MMFNFLLNAYFTILDPGRFQDSWRLSDGFVAAEAKTILPHRARSRWDLDMKGSYLFHYFFIFNSFIQTHEHYLNCIFVTFISRPDLMDNYLALVLSAFIRNGLLEVRFTNLFYFDDIIREKTFYDS